MAVTVLQRLLACIVLFHVSGRCYGGPEMFQIKAEDTKRYLLTECRTFGTEGFNCRCKDLGRTCRNNETNMINCGINCGRCLNETIQTFYVQKDYGGDCISANKLQNAAGFGAPFSLFNQPNGICATYYEGLNADIWPTSKCNTSDPNQLWFWTPGNLLMHYKTFNCLDTHGKTLYRRIKLSRCDSSTSSQKFICNDMFWFGITTGVDKIKITHALRHIGLYSYLIARTIQHINSGNTWTTYNTTNVTVCSSAIEKEILNVGERDTNSPSEIDYFGCLISSKECVQRVYTKSNVGELSQCKILTDHTVDNDTPSFSIENQLGSFYVKWLPNIYMPLRRKSFNFTVECLTEMKKFTEFYLPLQVKDVDFKTPQGCYQFVGNKSNKSSIAQLELNKDCKNLFCSNQINAPSLLHRNRSICMILWNNSAILDTNMTSWGRVKQSTRLFSLNKTDQNLYLQWRAHDISTLKGLTFNLTIFCYDGQHKNVSLAETSFLAFETKAGRSFGKVTSDNHKAPLAIILPSVLLVVILNIILVVCCCYHRRKRSRSMKPHVSQVNLQGNMNNSRELDKFETRAEDNPCYEECTATRHPAVTIARNQLYEHTNPDFQGSRPISDIYEKPIQSVQASVRALQGGKPAKKPKPVKVFKKKNNSKINIGHHNNSDDFYDEPMGFIAGNNHGNNSNLAPPSHDNRLSAPYIKTLPKVPPEENQYDYAAVGNASNSTPVLLAISNGPKKPPTIPQPYDHTYDNVTPDQPMGEHEAPYYDVLDYTHGKA